MEGRNGRRDGRNDASDRTGEHYIQIATTRKQRQSLLCARSAMAMRSNDCSVKPGLKSSYSTTVSVEGWKEGRMEGWMKHYLEIIKEGE